MALVKYLLIFKMAAIVFTHLYITTGIGIFIFVYLFLIYFYIIGV